MDIYSFIDSGDIREYLQKLKYEFTTVEAAFLVHHSRRRCMKEKLAAFQEIIETMPDRSRKSLRYTADSLHDHLRQFIDLQNRKLALFYENTGAVYQYSVYEYCEWRKGYDWLDCEDIFADLDTCLAASSDEENDDPTREFLIYKAPLLRAADIRGDEKPKRSSLRLNAGGDVMDVDVAGYPSDKRDIDIDCFLEDICIFIPTPFHCGDIVTDLHRPTEPFVLESIKLWNAEKMIEEGFRMDERSAEEHDRKIHRMLECCDDSAMIYYAYHWCGDETGLYNDDSWPRLYLSLERYRKPLAGEHRVLLPVSYALKKDPNLDIELICNATHLLWDESRIAKQRKSMESEYQRDALKEIGAIQDEQNNSVPDNHV